MVSPAPVSDTSFGKFVAWFSLPCSPRPIADSGSLETPVLEVLEGSLELETVLPVSLLLELLELETVLPVSLLPVSLLHADKHDYV